MKRLHALLTALTLSAVLLVVAAVAVASGGQRVTQGDPFRSCSTASDIFGGVVFPSTEPEVWLAANPSDPSNLIGSIQQDRWSDGGAQGLVAPYSVDGGLSWNEVPLPFNVCASAYYSGNVLHDPFTGLPYDRASDPWVDVGPDGTAYSVSISFNANDNGGSVGAATSSDGGRTWRNQQNIVAEDANDPSLPFNDKESVTADPARPGSAYAVWDRLQNIVCPPGVPPAQGNSDDRPSHTIGVAPAIGLAPVLALDCFDGPGMFSRTRDFGRTWSRPTQMVATPANEQTIANEIVADPRSGTLYDFYMYIHADNTLTVENVASHDGGRSWGPRQVVSDSQTIGITNPATGDPVRTGDIIPQPAIDPRTGRLYVVWQDSRANAVDPNEDALFISTSSHGGLTGSWSRPAVVNDPRDEAAFTPAIKVLPSGAVVVQYYTLQQQRHSSRRDTLPTSIVVRTTDDPGTSFTHREQSVGDDFNMLAAPFAGGYFTGDYEGLTVDLRDPTNVHTFFTATNCLDSRCAAVSGFDGDGNPIPSNAPNPTDVFSGSVRVG